MIEIVSYKTQWPEEFKDIAAKIRRAVADKAIAIHHIGSTSVPDLAANDIIGERFGERIYTLGNKVLSINAMPFSFVIS